MSKVRYILFGTLLNFMKSLVAIITLFLAGSATSFAQKGVDTQTQKIKDDTNKTTARPTDASRSFNWGKGKTEVRERLANPYPMTGRRDVLVESIVAVLKKKS
jgi:hypothetical protein